MLYKRLAFTLFLMLSWAAGSAAQQLTLSVPDTPVDAGTTVEIPINITELTQADAVVSGEWEFTTSSGIISLVDVDATGALLEGRNLLFNSTTGRLAFAGTDTITGSGALFTLTVEVDDNATKFQESTIGFRDVLFNEGEPTISTAEGTVRIRGISINPQKPQNPVIEGTTFQFGLIGDAVAPVIWSTSSSATATIGSSGLLTAVAPGTIRVYAEDNSGLRDSTDLFRIEPESLLDLTVSVSDETITQTLEGTITVSVTDITGLDIQSGQFEITYPQNKVDILSFSTEGTILEGTTPTTLVEGGLISVAFARSDIYTGSGALLNINVRVPLSADGTAEFTPRNILFNETIGAIADPGTLTINEAPVPVITPLQAELTIGETEQFSVVSGGTAPYTWNSSDPAVASIDPSSGLLEALSRGVIQITATDAENFTSADVEVIVNDITMSISDYSMSDGGTVSIPLEVMDVTGLGIFSYEVEIEYDASVVEFDALETAGTLSENLTVSASSEDGVATIAGATATPLAGSGSLIDVVFKRSESPGPDQETDLILKRVQFNEPGPDTPTATRVDGSIAIEGVSWTGNGDGTSWDDAANWSSTSVPGTDSDVLIAFDPGTAYTISVPGEITVNSLLITSPNVDLSIQDSLSVLATYIQTDATLSGPGAITVADKLTWNSGTMSGSGSLYPESELEITGNGTKVLNERTIVMQEESEVIITGNGLSGTNGAAIEILENARLTITAENTSSLSEIGTGGATLRNFGEVEKLSANSLFTINWTVESQGLIRNGPAGGIMRLAGPLLDNNGAYHSAAGSLEFNTNDTYAFLSGSTISSAQAGTIRFGTTGSGSSDITVPGTLNILGSMVIQSAGSGLASLTIPDIATISALGEESIIVGGSRGELTLESSQPQTVGTLVINSGGSVSMNSELTVNDLYELNHQSALFESDFDVQVNGDFLWSGGTMRGSGTTFANSGLAISGSSESNTKVLDVRNLHIVNGQVSYQGDRLFGGNGSIFRVGEAAEVIVRPPNEMTEISILTGSTEIPLFLNEGLISSTRNNNVLTINWDFQNPGIINLGSNDLVIEAPRGIINTGMLTGSGNLIANVENISGGLVQPGSETDNGLIQIEGNYTQDDASTMEIKIAGITAGSTFDQIRANNVALAGTLSVSLLNNFTPESSDRFPAIVWPGGTRTGNFSVFEGLEQGAITLAIRFLDEAMEIYDGSFGPSPGSASINVTVTSPPFQRAGRSVPINVNIQNTGNASLQRIRVENFNYSVSPNMGPPCPTTSAYENLKCRMERFGVTPPPPEPGMEEEYPFLLQQRFPEAIGGDPGGGSEGSEFTSVTGGGSSFGIGASEVCTNEPINPSVKAGTPVTDANLNECAYQIAKLALEFVPGADCFKLGVGITNSIGEGLYSGQFDLLGYLSANMVGAINCAGDAVPATKAIKIANKLNELASQAGGLKNVSDACSNAAGAGGAVSASGSSTTTCIGSYDPNDKVGPTGVLEDRYIASGDSLPYVVFFENLDEATAAAQLVIIKDTINTELFDLDTFSFGMIAWSDTSVSMEPNILSTSKDVDLRPEMDLILRIEADLDEVSGVLSWVFTSLDPGTMEPTLDPLAGFLPPNVTSPEGEGLVSYFISLKDDTPSNTSFGRAARIIFDENDPIDTPAWFNTLDTVAPTSSVNDLESVQTSEEFTVTWSGTDDASGVEAYTVYVSEDGGEFTVWQDSTSETSATFTGENGKSYAFYSSAFDNVGNAELRRDIADTQTRVELDTSTETASDIPTEFTLNQNYPNPFNPATSIQFGLPKTGFVSLQVFDMTGRRVATLVDENKTAGWHTVSFDASNLASGMYIYRLQSGDFVSTRKLILVK